MFFGPPASGSASTPQKTLQSFVNAFNLNDRRAMEALVQNSKHNPALEEADGPMLFGKRPVVSVSNVSVKMVSPSRAVVTCLSNSVAPDVKPQKPDQEQIEMVKVGANWLIMAPKPRTKPVVGAITTFALIMVKPELIKLTAMITKEERARENLKEVAIGGTMYFEDEDNTIRLKPEDYSKTLFPYVRDIRLFHSPLDKPKTISFSFNGNLSGRKLASIKDPKNTILFFDGKPGALNFRYDSKGLAAFCDGRVRFVTPAEAKSLVWK